jgi:uncharacterized DUF497 family protein
LRYRFDWDPAKERANISKHRVSFRRAATVFRDSNQLSIYDKEHSEHEDRWITLGIDGGGVLRVVVHTFEQIADELCDIRIISAKSYPQRSGPVQNGSRMKKEYDFSIGERAKFYHPDAVFCLPIYLDPDVSDYMDQLAGEKDVEVQDLVHEWLRANIKLVQSVRQESTG